MATFTDNKLHSSQKNIHFYIICIMKQPNIINITPVIKFSIFIIVLNHLLTYVTPDIPPGSILHASNPTQTWSSPTKTFSLLFLPVSSDTYSLCIAYNGIVPIWKPAGVSDGNSTLHFLSDGNLRLINRYGVVLWESNTAHIGITRATLEDSGNLVLKNESFSLWHSFEHLRDTLVPSQNFTVRSVLTSGLYSFRLNRSGVLTLTWNDSILYWIYVGNSSIVHTNLKNPSLSFMGSGILSLYDPVLSNPVNLVYSSDFGEGYGFRFLRLDHDGNLRIYSASNDGGDVSVKWNAVSDQCEVFGYCGNFGICSYNETDDPTCSCPSENFVPYDSNDSRKGCKRKVEIKDCPDNETMLQLDHTKFWTYPPETSSDTFYIGTSACRFNCLYSTSCVASAILADGTAQCYIKTSGFVSAYQSPTIPGSSFVKICGPIEPNPPPQFSQTTLEHHAWIISILALMGGFSGLVIFTGVFWWLCCRKNPKFGGVSAQYTLLEYASGTPVQFSYKDLQKATRRFKEKLGAGGFGAVYKGNISNEVVVAVKQLEGIEQGEKHFRMEVATISSTHHLNLVRLIGFCSEGRHRLLVYEFLKNGSLDSFLFRGVNKTETLNWEQRYNIILGTARGITYLHEECRDCIVHCDIKPENILLDENFNAKVSDFGLAKLISYKDQRYRTLTSVTGTRGYLAPEWLSNLPITSKADVYSFGKVLLEIVTGRRNFEISGETNGKKASSWAYEEVEKGNVRNILDLRLGDQFVMEQVVRAVLVSFWCIHEQPSHRPMMGKVVQMLEGIIGIETPPLLKANEEDIVGGSSICVSTITVTASSITPSGPTSSTSSSMQRPGFSGKGV